MIEMKIILPNFLLVLQLLQINDEFFLVESGDLCCFDE